MSPCSLCQAQPRSPSRTRGAQSTSATPALPWAAAPLPLHHSPNHLQGNKSQGSASIITRKLCSSTIRHLTPQNPAVLCILHQELLCCCCHQQGPGRQKWTLTPHSSSPSCSQNSQGLSPGADRGEELQGICVSSQRQCRHSILRRTRRGDADTAGAAAARAGPGRKEQTQRVFPKHGRSRAGGGPGDEG